METSLAPVCSEWKVRGCSVLTRRELSEAEPACSVGLLQQCMMYIYLSGVLLCVYLPRLAAFCAENILP